jgi:hypothetical protein
MHQRTTVLRALQPSDVAATARRSQPQIDDFCQLLRDREDACWEELVAEFRRSYYDAFDEVVPALFATDDPIIIYNLVRSLDASQPKERDALQQFVQQCESEKHQASLRVIAETRSEELLAAIRHKQDLPPLVQEALT